MPTKDTTPKNTPLSNPPSIIPSVHARGKKIITWLVDKSEEELQVIGGKISRAELLAQNFWELANTGKVTLIGIEGNRTTYELSPEAWQDLAWKIVNRMAGPPVQETADVSEQHRILFDADKTVSDDDRQAFNITPQLEAMAKKGAARAKESEEKPDGDKEQERE